MRRLTSLLRQLLLTLQQINNHKYNKNNFLIHFKNLLVDTFEQRCQPIKERDSNGTDEL